MKQTRKVKLFENYKIILYGSFPFNIHAFRKYYIGQKAWLQAASSQVSYFLADFVFCWSLFLDHI